MNAVATIANNELNEVLKNSLYPGASDSSINLVLNYCKASGLDPMLKPCHIVPIYDAKIKAMRDVIMPGIGLYRTIAARTGQYAGVSEPVFGDDVNYTFESETVYDQYTKSNKTIPEQKVTFPAFCKVTVRKLMDNGLIAEFSATERWMENYATASKNTSHPNAMWQRRPYAQLAKCAEAQALRKAFPEIGAQPTADETQEIEINPEFNNTPIVEPAAASQPPAKHGTKPSTVLKEIPQKWFDDNKSAWMESAQIGETTKEQLVEIMAKKGGIFTAAQMQEVESWFAPAIEHDNFEELE